MTLEEYQAEEARARDAVQFAARDFAAAVREAAMMRAAAMRAAVVLDRADAEARNAEHAWEKAVAEWRAVLSQAVPE